jgi:hypothetical protein
VPPGTAPGPDSTKPPEYVPVPPEVLAAAFKGAFGMACMAVAAVTKRPADFIALSDKEAKDLADGWKPVMDHYKVNLGLAPIWAGAIGATMKIMAPRFSEVMRRRGIGMAGFSLPKDAEPGGGS